jgi:16S rRNA (cytosine967-C5)-methyltransferase
VAFAAIDEHKRTATHVSAALDTFASAIELPSNDRRLAIELACGVIRRKATLDTLIQQQSQRDRYAIEGRLWTLLQLGAYQLVFMDSIPPHAAVHETVELAERLGQPRWKGFLNGVLRSLERNLTDERVTVPDTRAVPLTDGQFRMLHEEAFADPDSDPTGYFIRAFSFPNWLATRWAGRFDFDELTRIGFWFDRPAPFHLRVNCLKTDRETVIESLQQAGTEAVPGELAESIRLAGSTRVDQLPGFSDGLFSVQDESAMGAVALLDPQPDQSVLDMCAAPGTKSAHMAERMGNRGRVLSTDVHAARLGLVAAGCRRLGIDIVETQGIDRDGSNTPDGPFDAVLVDVPCSNTGVLGKRPEARWRLKPDDLVELPSIQQRLLLQAADRVAVGGRIVYSTCSIEPEENEQIVQAVIEQRPGLKLQQSNTYIPGQPGDGGFQALIVREA